MGYLTFWRTQVISHIEVCMLALHAQMPKGPLHTRGSSRSSRTGRRLRRPRRWHDVLTHCRLFLPSSGETHASSRLARPRLRRT